MKQNISANPWQCPYKVDKPSIFQKVVLKYAGYFLEKKKNVLTGEKKLIWN
jgi:hypothetical protein